MEESKKLTAKERAWADNYLLTLNKAESARRAKYKGDNATLAHVGWENYRKAHIQAYLKEQLAQMAMPAEEVLRRLTDMASTQLADFAYIQTSSDLAECENSQVIKKFKRKVTRTKLGDEYEELELELYDAQSALEKLGRYHNLFKETQTNYNIDLTQLSDVQLQRLASGEEPLTVLIATESES